jgi:hypothetical protein
MQLFRRLSPGSAWLKDVVYKQTDFCYQPIDCRVYEPSLCR